MPTVEGIVLPGIRPQANTINFLAGETDRADEAVLVTAGLKPTEDLGPRAGVRIVNVHKEGHIAAVAVAVAVAA